MAMSPTPLSSRSLPDDSESRPSTSCPPSRRVCYASRIMEFPWIARPDHTGASVDSCLSSKHAAAPLPLLVGVNSFSSSGTSGRGIRHDRSRSQWCLGP